MERIIEQDPVLLIPIIAVGGGVLIALASIVFGIVHKMASTREKERSRREIAAYVAEGSITPDDGERLINAGRRTPN